VPRRAPEAERRASPRHGDQPPAGGDAQAGRTPDEDLALERELLADEKERAEHIMLVDLGRNDVGRGRRARDDRAGDVMSIERYSHVMHISRR
jgi:anthranilate synthase component 1